MPSERIIYDQLQPVPAMIEKKKKVEIPEEENSTGEQWRTYP